MPKSKGIFSPAIAGPCPNPHCPSRTPLFGNLTKHLSQIPECMTFYQVLRKDVNRNLSMSFDNASPNTRPTEARNATMADDASLHQYIDPLGADAMLYDEEPNDNDFVLDNANDFEHTNFSQLDAADNLELITHPRQAIRTNARRIEVTLLKILTELEAMQMILNIPTFRSWKPLTIWN